MLYRSNKIYVDDSPIHGRGVFASEKLKKGEILEECHIIIAEKNIEYPYILKSHFFSWPKGGDDIVICLGYGSIFNHSSESPNADWETSVIDNKIIFFTRREIEIGEEILTNYGNVNFP